MKIKKYINNILGTNLLNAEQKKLLASNYFFVLSFVLSGVFINTLIFSKDGSAAAVIRYYIFMFLSAALCSLLQGYTVRILKPLKTFRLGIAAYMVYYAAVLIAGDKIGDVSWLAGIISGASSALYFITYAVFP
jgi:hypothetical protein